MIVREAYIAWPIKKPSIKKKMYAHSTQVLPRSKIPCYPIKCKTCQLINFFKLIPADTVVGVQVRRRPTPPYPNLTMFLSLLLTLACIAKSGSSHLNG